MLIEIDALDLSFQPPDCLITETVDEYVRSLRSGKDFQPVEVYSDGETLLLFDGFHRIAAARIVRVKTVEANVTAGTYADMKARWHEYLERLRAELRSTR